MAFPYGYTRIGTHLTHAEAKEVAANSRKHGRHTKLIAAPTGWQVYVSDNKHRKPFGGLLQD